MSQDWFTVVITAKREEAAGIFKFVLMDPAGRALPPFEAGAHIEVKIGDKIRHYSLSNAPGERHRYVIAVQREPQGRGGSRAFCDDFHAGQRIVVRGPRNNFRMTQGTVSSVLLAGGIGITPIISMAEACWEQGRPFELHYTVRTPARMAFARRMGTAPFRLLARLYFDDGPVDQRLDLERILGAPRTGRHLYCCGPTAMIDAVLACCSAADWPDDHIHFERFSAAATTGDERPFHIEIRSTGRLIFVPGGKTAMQAPVEAGVHIPVSCEQGVCGTCVTRVLAGVPDHRDVFLTEAEREANQTFVPCCSRAKSDVLVLDL